MKRCGDCGDEKPIEEFASDGHGGLRRRECNGCRSKRRRARYAASPDAQARQAARVKAQRAKNAAAVAAHRKAYTPQYRNANREKCRARRAVRKAIKRGKIPPAAKMLCIKCGAKAAQYHHHNGYAKEQWLDVVPMCYTCHGIESRKPL